MSRPALGRGGVRGRGPAAGSLLARRGRGRGQAIQHGAQFDSHITTIGVRRPGFGVAGKKIQIRSNFFRTSIPERIIYHYDVIESSLEQKLPIRLNMLLIQELQSFTAPDVFNPPAAYDGRKNIFSIKKFDFGESESKEFHVTYPRASEFPVGARNIKVYKVKLTKVAEINPEILRRFIEGKQSHDNAATTAITAMNVVVRMQPTMLYTYNVRSFFVPDNPFDLNNGLQLWQGFFQSIRPSKGCMMINIDIATGVVFKGGPLINLCLANLNKTGVGPRALAPGRGNDALQERDRLKLQRFCSGIRIYTRIATNQSRNTARVLRKFSSLGADSLQFQHNGQVKSVAQYYNEIRGRPLNYPSVICAEVGNGALIPLELCTVEEGQLSRKPVPPESIQSMVRFASKKPRERIERIGTGKTILGYATSEYVRDFGLSTAPEGPIIINARVLEPPALSAKELDTRGAISRKNFVPRDGAWNMDKKKFYTPATRISPMAFFILESDRYFRADDARACFTVLRHVLMELGIAVPPQEPETKWGNPQGNIIEQLENLVNAVRRKAGVPPQLIVVILPDLGNDLYTAVKHFGDVHMGIVTQCLRKRVCKIENPQNYNPRVPCRPTLANIQYYSNVALKINVKLGGVNMIFSPSGSDSINDPFNPTIIMGADVVHPAPGAVGRPSYTALVGNTDSDMVKYVATTRVQQSRLEIINDLKEMAIDILRKWQENRTEGERKRPVKSHRIMFYRDGVSEGQFQQVLDIELPALKAAIHEVKMDAKITFVVVGKRHHVRFFPQNPADSDKSGNCPAGTVVDEIGHPVEFDFYLQSHAGILGTSRPSHYSVLYDDNKFSPDTLQKFTYHLCYTYARATRAVSIPAPVYYADIVCSRAKIHYDPYNHGPQDVDEETPDLEAFKIGFKPLHKNLANVMYFSVRCYSLLQVDIDCSFVLVNDGKMKSPYGTM